MHVIAPNMSCVVNLPLSADQPNELDQALEAGYAEVYVITPEGIIKHHKLRGAGRYLRIKVDKIPGYEAPALPQEINFLPAGKIPKELFDQIVAFFYGVIEKNGDKALEAMAHILWNPEQGYHIGIPDQQISAAAVRYDWSYIPSGTSVVCDIHSHNYMNAFFSGTDNADDRANISFSGVVGQMNKESIQTVWRFNYQDRKFEAKFEDIFDSAAVSVPADWLNKVELAKAPVTYGKGQYIGDPSNGRGRADHLKQYQFKSKDQDELVNGNRAGPHVRGHSASPRRNLDDYDNSDFWGLGEMGYNGRDVGESVFANVTESALHSVGGVYSGKALGGVESQNEEENDFGIASASPGVDPEFIVATDHERWDEIVINNGETAADAFCMIDLLMPGLSMEDELLEPLISDMFKLSSDAAQLKIFKTLYDELSPRDQERLANTGL